MRVAVVAGMLVVLVAAVSGQASIIWSQSSCAPDADGAITNCSWSWPDNSTMLINETLNSSPGHLVGHIATDTATDPTLDFVKNVTNATGNTWTGYVLNMYMQQPFTIAAGTGPLGWLASATTYPTGTYLDAHGNSFTNMGRVTFTNLGGSNILPAGSGTFGASVTFGGFTLYSFELEQVAVPEPMSLALLALGGLLLRRRP